MRLPHVILMLSLAAACKSRVSADECTHMLDHYVEMTAAQDPTLAGLPEARASELRDAKRLNKRHETSFKRAQAQCKEEVSRFEYECAVNARTPNDWEACID